MAYRTAGLYVLRLFTLGTGTFMPRLLRDTVLFFAGLGLIFNEAVIRTQEPRFYLLLLYAAMIGLPAFLGADDVQAALRRLGERAPGRNGNGNGNGHRPPEPPPPPPAQPTQFARLRARLVWP